MILTQVLGLAIACAMQGLITLAAYGLWSERWIVGYLIVFCASASSLTWMALYDLAWLPYVVLTGISLLAALGIARLVRSRTRIGATRADIVGYLALGFVLLFAAYPDYRIDQWNYSLAVAKRIWIHGPLGFPILNDHVYFTGSFEYFLILFRLFSEDDVLIQSAVNAFTTSVFFALSYGLISTVWSRSKAELPALALMTAFFFFSFESRASFMNAKPEVLILFFYAFASALVPKHPRA